MSDGWLTGKLLLSLPTVRADAFYRTVIWLLDHGEHGALGVILNRPTEIAVGEIFPALKFEAAEPAVLYEGGPVSPDGIICLGRRGDATAAPGFTPVLEHWGSIDPRETPPDGVDAVRVYRGYAGWSARQLEDELERGSWLVVEALAEDAVSAEPEELWEHVLDRQGPSYARVKLVPRDPSLN